MKACFVVLFAVVIAAVNAACNRVDVNVSNSDELQNALLKAQPGHNIILKGVYSGINKPLALKASGEKDCPIVIGCKTPGEAVIRSPFDFSESSFVTISNIILTDDTDSHGFLFNTCSDIIIENVHVTRFDGNGITLQDSKHVTVRNCTIDYLQARSHSIQQRGISITGTSYCTVEQCTFGDNIDSIPIAVFDDCSNNVFSENIFYGTSRWSFGWISFSGCKGCTNNEISRNFFENPDGQKNYGIDVSDTSGIVKENLMIFNNGKYVEYAIKIKDGDSKPRICASNRIFGTNNITNGVIDPSC